MLFLVVTAACCLASAPPAAHSVSAGSLGSPQGARETAPSTASSVATAAASSDEAQGTAYFEFLKGRRLESLGQPVEALAAYERASRLEPASAQIRAEIAALHARNNRPDEAVAAAKSALKLDADNAEAYWVLGTVYAALTEAREEENAGRQLKGQGPVAPQPALPARKEIIGYLEKARPARLYDNSLHMTLARLYLDEENWAKAIEVTSYVVEREPGAVDAAYMLAQAYEGAGKVNDAIAALEEAILVDPDSPRALVYLGELYGRVKKHEDAAAAFGRAAELRPGTLDLRLRQAGALVAAGRATAARDLLRETSELHAKEPRVLYLLAEVERSLQDYDGAEATARKLIALAPKQPFGPHALAQVYAQRHNYKAVIDTLTPLVTGVEQSTADSRTYAPIWVSLGYAHQELGDFDKAIASFERAKRAGGDDVAYDAYLVQANIAAGRNAKAVELAAAARARQPKNLRLMNLEAQARLQNGDTTKAIEILEQAVQAFPNDVQAHVALASVFSEARQFNRAEDVLTKASTQFPADINVPFQLGAVLEEQNRPADAERAFRKALAIDPMHAPTLNYLGYMLAERGQRLEEAVTLIAQAVKIDPFNGSYLDSLGWAYFKQGKLDQAREYLVKAGEQMPVNSVVQEHVGDVLFALHDVNGAIAAWQRALKGDGRSIDRAGIERKITQAQKK